MTFTSTTAYADHLASLAPSDRLAAEARAAIDLFDVDYYLGLYPDVAKLQSQPLAHYCFYGWREGRQPRAGFDTLWYARTHLGDHPDLNPLAHYGAVGRRLGLATSRAAVPAPLPAAALSASARRCFLFAGYHPDGVLDEAVVVYLTELARHGDVYYRADCDMSEEELAKVTGIVRGAWAGRHEGYDFGSYARLATDHVGWAMLETYDEVVLVNDSCFLLRGLDDLFEQMSAEPCDWWGLQATANPSSHRLRGATAGGPQQPGQPGLSAPVGLVRLAASFEDMLVAAELTDFHVGSYFVALRSPALRREEVRAWLERGRRSASKAAAITAEVGLSQLLIDLGHRFATYVPGLYPFHPVLGDSAFDLVDAGFPLLKRRLLTDNPFDVDTAQWRERVLAAVPGAPLDVVDAALARLVLHWKGFVAADRASTPRDDVWAFPVCAYDHTLGGNERAVLEQVRDDPSITKVILTRSRPVDLAGANVVVVPLESRQGQDLLLQAGVVFVKHGPYLNVPWPLEPHHRVINLWHGIPLKRFGFAALDTAGSREQIAAIHRGCHAVVTSSAMDSLAMSAAFHPLTVHDMWPTGLPRNDFITCAEERLPADLAADLATLRAEVGDRRLVMFLPTFKNGQADAYYDFTPSEVERLAKWADQQGAVLGIREHMADSARTYSRLLAPLSPIDLSAQRFPNLEVLYRAASALVSDYSSCLVDFLLTGRPVISFAYDYQRYAEQERGLFYDLEEVLPGPVCRTFDELAGALDAVFEDPDAEQRAEYELRRGMFFDHLDDGAAARVVERVRGLAGR